MTSAPLRAAQGPRKVRRGPEIARGALSLSCHDTRIGWTPPVKTPRNAHPLRRREGPAMRGFVMQCPNVSVTGKERVPSRPYRTDLRGGGWMV